MSYVLPASCALLFTGALVSGVVAAMAAHDRQAGNLRRAVISLSVFSSLCMLVTGVYWIPAAFFRRSPAPPAYVSAPPRPAPAFPVQSAAGRIG